MIKIMKKTDPRWGQNNREKKALAILETLKTENPNLKIQKQHWLDIGCGSGGIASSLAPYVGHMYGIDPEPWQRWESFEEKNKNLNFFIGGYEAIDQHFKEKSMDVVICNQVYEHVDNVDNLIMAIFYCLKNDGVCYFAGPNLLWPIEPHVFLPFVHWLPRSIAHAGMRFFGLKKWQELDAYSWSYWKLKKHLKKSGFDVASIIPERIAASLKTNNSFWLLILLKPWFFLIRWLSPISPSFVFLITKSKNA